MDRRLNLPVFGNSPGEYDRAYLDDISRKLNILIAALRTPGVGRQSSLVLTDLPTSATGLEAGEIYVLGDGILRIARPLNMAYVTGVLSIGRVGTVTVTT